jgi:hypothetical protein
MYEIFTVKKNTGTYSDSIEVFGLMNLLKELQSRLDLDGEILLEDKGVYFEIKVKPFFSESDIEQIKYFPLFQYVIQKEGETFEESFFDYPKQRLLKKERQELVHKAYKDFSGKEKENQRKHELARIEKIFSEEKRIYSELDVYSQIITPNNFTAFDKLFQNYYLNKDSFPKLIKSILNYYGGLDLEFSVKDYKSFNASVTALQIFNPTTGKGLNKDKAKGASTTNVSMNWIEESMKISGAISNMLCQLVKVGSSYDLKVVVPDFKKIDWQRQSDLTTSFKKNIKGNTPLKVDILNLLIILKELIKQTEEYQQDFRLKTVLNGLHSVYQKDLGQNKAVVNIAILQTPEFIKFCTGNEASDWVEFLDSQIQLIASIDEQGDATQGLQAYRTFFTGSHFPSWERFIFWYSGYVSSNLSNKKYTIPFKEKLLNQLFKNMETTDFKISEIITNDGFLKVAHAIRMSTVSLQFLPKEKRKFEVRYGVAQNLQNKSKSKKDLAEFIGEFIGIYNAETARKAELEKGFRKPVRENELNDFYSLLDKYPSKVVGALLASYGFALTEKDKVEVVNELEIDETE